MTVLGGLKALEEAWHQYICYTYKNWQDKQQNEEWTWHIYKYIYVRKRFLVFVNKPSYSTSDGYKKGLQKK